MTDMTQAPTPGPLMVGDYAVRLEDHPLVKSGEVHRVTEMFRGGYLGFARPVGGEWNPSGWRKCDADGWMPWSGGENPVPGQAVEAKFENGIVSEVLDSECFGWDRHKDPVVAPLYDIIAFRLAPTPGPLSVLAFHCESARLIASLRAEAERIGKGIPTDEPGFHKDIWTAAEIIEQAEEAFAFTQKMDALAPTAPVEASGSGWHREGGLIYSLMQDGWRKGQPVMVNDVMIRVEACNRSETDIEPIVQTILAALRPQPSGETREAVARLEAELAHPCRVGSKCSVDADDLRALLSARPVALGRVAQSEEPSAHNGLVAGSNPAATTSPLALGGQQGEVAGCAESEVGRAVYERIEKLIGAKAGTPECNELAFLAFIVESVEEVGGYDGPFASILAPTTPARAEAQDERALSILDCLLDHSGARGSFDAMRHGDAVKDAEELLRSARSPGHTDLMVTPESIDAYMKDNPMEAKDEGAAGEIKSCPFCGGEAEIIHLDDDDNAGGSCVCCTKCQASGNVEFGRKENFVENWNRRSHPSPPPAADADRVRIAVEFINAKINAPLTGPTHGAWDRGRIAGLKEALAALKSTAAKEGGA